MENSFPRISNIFLHFLNKDSLLIYGAPQNMPPPILVEHLSEYVTVGALLCDEYCIVPPGWVDEYDTTRLTLERHVELIRAGVIRLPMRESTLGDFHNKRLRQYSPFRKSYPDLFKENNILFLEEQGIALLGRHTSIGTRIKDQWLEAALSDPTVVNVTEALSNRKRIGIVRLAAHLADGGSAIAWPGVEQLLLKRTGMAPQQYRHLLQRLNFAAYLDEYDLQILSGIPLARHDFGLSTGSLDYDYGAFRTAFEAARAWHLIRQMDDFSLMELKSTRGFIDFRIAFSLIASTHPSIFELRRSFALPTRRSTTSDYRTTELAMPSEYTSGRTQRVRFSYDQIDDIAFRLEISAAASGEFLAAKSEGTRGQVGRTIIGATRAVASRSARTEPRVQIGIFVALDLELRILADRWKLQNNYGDQLWRGSIGDTSVAVYSPRAMGRVPAALDTLEILRKYPKEFNMLIVAGLAGGFSEKKVQKGSLLIADGVVDLATRKITEKSGEARPIFRPREFAVDQRLREYLQSGSFDRGHWLGAVAEEEEWPDGLRPVIHHGPICSGDEVVSSSAWVSRLLDAWPLILGVDMEAGGVCAAADRLGLKVAVVRVVSDFADPAKADDEWRSRGMKTIANLFEHLDFATVCQNR